MPIVICAYTGLKAGMLAESVLYSLEMLFKCRMHTFTVYNSGDSFGGSELNSTCKC